MSIFHAGEIAALDGLPIIESPYIDHPPAFYIWMHARIGCPLETLVTSSVHVMGAVPEAVVFLNEGTRLQVRA